MSVSTLSGLGRTLAMCVDMRLLDVESLGQQRPVPAPASAAIHSLEQVPCGLRLLSDVLLQKLQRAGACELRGLCVVRAALFTIEAVARPRIEVVGLVLVRRGDLLGFLQGYGCIGFAPLEQHRALRLLVDERRYGAAVVGDGTRKTIHVARRFE